MMMLSSSWRPITEELDELRLVASIVGQLGKAQKLTPNDAANLQRRITVAADAISERIQRCGASLSGEFDAAAHASDQRRQSTSFEAVGRHDGHPLAELALGDSLRPAVWQSEGATPTSGPKRARLSSTTGSGCALQPVISPRSGGRLESLTAPPAVAAATPRPPTRDTRNGEAGAPPPSRSGSSRFAMQAKPSSASLNVRGSVRNPTARTSAHGADGGADVPECIRVMPAVLHTTLECIALLVQCESGAVFIPVRDEMVCCAHAAERPAYPPATIRHQAAGSLTGGVFSSGVAVSQTTTKGADDNGKAAASLLLFPIRGPVTHRIIGVLQLTNKHKGRSNFTAADETLACCGASILGAQMERHAPVRWSEHFYDALSLHGSGSPFEAAERHAVLPSRAEARAHGVDDLDAAVARRTVLAVDGFVEQQLIHRSTVPVSLSRRQALAERALGLSAVPSLLEVDSYLVNLQDCWRRGVDMAVVQSHEDKQKSEQMKRLREELKRANAEVVRLSEELRLQRLDSDDYRKEYTTLKEELESFLKQRRAID